MKNKIALAIAFVGVALEVAIAVSDLIYPYHIVLESGKLVFYKGELPE